MKKEALLILPMLLTIPSVFIISFYAYLNLTLINAMLWAFDIEGLTIAIIFLIYFKREG